MRVCKVRGRACEKCVAVRVREAARVCVAVRVCGAVQRKGRN